MSQRHSKTSKQKDKHLDSTVADSFPASDPPAHSGITGIRHQPQSRPPSHQRGDDARPTGHPTSDRHASETAHSWEDQGTSPRR